MQPLLLLPTSHLIQLRPVCKDFLLPWLRLDRHIAAFALMRILEDIGLDLDFAPLLEPNDTIIIWKCIADQVFHPSSPRMYTYKEQRDPLLPRRHWRLRSRKHIYVLIG